MFLQSTHVEILTLLEGKYYLLVLYPLYDNFFLQFSMCYICFIYIFCMQSLEFVFINFRLFERGLVYVGLDFLSYTIWDKYIEYEFAQQKWSRLAMIYTRILENPNQQLDRYFNG